MIPSRTDSGKAGREECSSYDGGDEEAADSRLVAHTDEEASTSGAAGDEPDTSDEAEGIPLIQIHSYDYRSKDGDCGPLSPDQPQCRICLDSGGDDMISPCRCRGTQKFVHRECLDNWRATKEGFAFANCTECRSAFHLRANLPSDRWWLRLKFQLLVLRDHAAIFIIVQLTLVHVTFNLPLREFLQRLVDLSKCYHRWKSVVLCKICANIALEKKAVMKERYFHYTYLHHSIVKGLEKSDQHFFGLKSEVVGSLGLLVYTFYGDELREMFGYDRHPFGFYALVVTVALLIGLLYGFFIAIICGQNISNRHYHILAKQELTKEYVVENLSEDEEPPELDSGHINELKMLGLF